MSNPPRMAASRPGGIQHASVDRASRLHRVVGSRRACCDVRRGGECRATAGAIAETVAALSRFWRVSPPSKYQGRIFKLSQDYPTRKPAIEPAVRKILSIDFTKDWKAYADAVRDYIYEGNIEADGVANDFYLEDNKVRRWYHVPWQHWGPFGREGIHGLTKEGPVIRRCLRPRKPACGRPTRSVSTMRPAAT